MEANIPHIPRDISWLSFNYRVLQEAKDPAVPLFERIKFLAIYSNNLDEFFKVRVAHQRNLLQAGKKAKKGLDVAPKQILKKIHKIVNKQQEEFSDIFENQIIPELRRYDINIKRRLDLNEEQKQFVESYFEENLLPFVQPVLLLGKKIRPFLNNAALYLSVHLKCKKNKSAESDYAIIKIPSDYLPRFIELPSQDGEKNIIILDDIVRHSVSWFFPGYDIVDTYSFKLTRDAELYIDDEFSGDLVQKIKKSLNKRKVGPPSRFVYDREMSNALLAFLTDTFELDEADILREGRYHNNFDFFSFPDFGMQHLKNKPLPPLAYKALEECEDIFAAITEQDHLLHYPYQEYESVIRLFETAAKDPRVTHIKIVQYRVAKKSRIMNALMEAAKMGKQVTVFVEVKARFDEEANLRWGEKLEAAGVNVHYSFPGLKVHSKLALIRRVEEGRNHLYGYLSTGNFHETTAKIYSDHGLFTANRRILNEVARVFTFLETVQLPQSDFEHLLVGQFNLRNGLVERIDREINYALSGMPARMVLKMNSLEDKDMIMKLYEASQAGVEIKLIVRGICCLVPGVKGWSENIEAVSIVDRYLEHSRVFWFHNNGEDEIYLSSADFMRRNLTYRIETIFPLLDESVKQMVKDHINLQLQDNVKARLIDEAANNIYRKNNIDLLIRSQIETYYYIRRKSEEEAMEEEDYQIP